MEDRQAVPETVYEPTPDRVHASCRQFDEQNGVMEQALTELFGRYPRNNSNPHILLKVTALNALYSTRVLALGDMARHICEHGKEVDSALALGSPEIVDTIARVTISSTGKERCNYSFASKYCSWHKPDSYPIWDSRVNAYLTWLKKRPSGGFILNTPDSWTHYREFVDVINNLCKAYKLGTLSFKQVDKFLYTEGEKLMAAKERMHTATNDITVPAQP